MSVGTELSVGWGRSSLTEYLKALFFGTLPPRHCPSDGSVGHERPCEVPQIPINVTEVSLPQPKR